MKNIIDSALKKTKTTLLFAVLIIIVGSYSRVNIPIAASPNVTLPFVTVAVFLEGAQIVIEKIIFRNIQICPL